MNAALYGAGQRRRRTFMFAYRKDTRYGKKMTDASAGDIIKSKGFMVSAFPIASANNFNDTEISTDLAEVSDNFRFDFENAGCMRDGKITTAKVKELEEESIKLIALLEKGDVDRKYFIKEDKMAKWEYLKGAKKIERTAADGHKYFYSEGPVAFPDPWDRPGRTMLTSESTLNRSTHVVKDYETGDLRLLTPVEAERLQGFNDNWTNTGMPEKMRYFCMGNSLVVPMITRMGKILDKIIAEEK